jgi:hypothetical protein
MSDGQDKTLSVVDTIEYANSQVQSLQQRQSMEQVALTSGVELQQTLDRDRQRGVGKDEGLHQTVYEWHVNKLPEEQIVRASKVREVSMAYFMDLLKSRSTPARKAWRDEQHRDTVVMSQQAYQDLAQTHPRLILMLSASDVTEQKLQHLLNLIELRERHEHSNKSLEKKQAEVSRYFMSNFVRAALPGEEEEAVRTGTGLRGELVSGDEIPRS